MDINEMLKGVLCQECGKEHKCPIEKVYIENGAISHLASFAQSYNNVLIVADENTYSAAGDKTEAQLAGKTFDADSAEPPRFADFRMFANVQWLNGGEIIRE